MEEKNKSSKSWLKSLFFILITITFFVGPLNLVTGCDSQNGNQKQEKPKPKDFQDYSSDGGQKKKY